MKKINKKVTFDRFDDLVFKKTGHYKRISFNNVLLESVKTSGSDKCKICYFNKKHDICDILPCSQVVYVRGKNEGI